MNASYGTCQKMHTVSADVGRLGALGGKVTVGKVVIGDCLGHLRNELEMVAHIG